MTFPFVALRSSEDGIDRFSKFPVPRAVTKRNNATDLDYRSNTNAETFEEYNNHAFCRKRFNTLKYTECFSCANHDNHFQEPGRQQGMPPALLGQDASASTLSEQHRLQEMERIRPGKRLDPVLCPTDEESIPPPRIKNTQPSLCPTDEEAAAHSEIKSKRSADYIWRSQFAGGIAGCAAKTAIAPLDRVKILFQTSNPQFAKYTGSWFGVVAAIRSIYTSEGSTGLFRGHSATLLRIYPYAAIKFVAYEQIRAVVIPSKEHETSLRRFASGSLAGVTSVFFTYPLEVVRVRLAFETKKEGRSSLRDIVKRIYNEQPPAVRAPAVTASQPMAQAAQAIAASTVATAKAVTPLPGLGNFYRGFFATLIGMVPYAGMSFLTHDKVGDLFRTPAIAKYTTLPSPSSAPAGKAAPLNWWAELTSGGVAGLVSQTASYPLEVIRRRMQVGGAVGDGHRLKIAETARLIVRESGYKGFFIGLTIGYVKVVPMVAVSFYTYERMKQWLGI